MLQAGHCANFVYSVNLFKQFYEGSTNTPSHLQIGKLYKGIYIKP